MTVKNSIARYHDERRLLRKKSEEKDRLITEMVAHHRAMTDRLHYLTAAVDQLRVERRLFRDDTNGELESTESGAPQSETVDDRANDFAHADALAARSKALSRAAAEVIDDDDVDVYYPRSPVERGNHVKDELDSRFITYPPCPDCNDAEPIDV